MIVQPDWITRRVPVAIALAKLSVFRPATVDLILTKMARGDAEDLADIRFLLSQDSLTPDELRAAFACARVPDVPEIRALFEAAKPRVLDIARSVVHSNQNSERPP